ncbi:MAG: hypothetical protein ACI808_002307 [Paraglaciecola sp.]|jgi:hypothetical protein
MKRSKKYSNSLFWAKHLGLAMILIVMAAVVLILQNSNDSELIPEGASGPKSLSQNMTDFYAEYRLSSRHPREEGIGDFVMEVNPSEKPLHERLKKMESLQKPMSDRWEGENKHRSFKAGSTLRDAITDYAQSEGMQVIWELDQDFIVKHQFQMDNSILGSLRMIASAIDGNFDGQVRAYFCPKQRSLVITANETEYLKQNCTEARS